MKGLEDVNNKRGFTSPLALVLWAQQDNDDDDDDDDRNSLSHTH